MVVYMVSNRLTVYKLTITYCILGALFHLVSGSFIQCWCKKTNTPGAGKAVDYAYLNHICSPLPYGWKSNKCEHLFQNECYGCLYESTGASGDTYTREDYAKLRSFCETEKKGRLDCQGDGPTDVSY